MKKYIVMLSALAVFAALGLVMPYLFADGTAQAVSPNLVISQVQAGSVANANDEFVEIHNNGASPVDLNGYRVVYRSQNGANDVATPFAAWTTPTILQPGQYYLIAATSYDGGIVPDKTYDPSACSCSMSATNGGLAIRFGANNTGTIIDSIGWGSVTNGFNEGTATPAAGNDNSKVRAQNGCQDTDNNSVDFTTLTPGAARNSLTSPFPCSGSGSTLFAAISASQTNVPIGASTLVTVTTIPATDPPSTGITVTADFSQIGGSPTQALVDDGTEGDVTPGDGIFSYQATIPQGTTGGPKVITAVAADQQNRTVNMTLNLTVNAPLPDEDPLLLGNPSNATADTNNPTNYLMIKPQYTLSYNRDKGTPNWVAWRLDTSWLGSAARQDNYRADTSLPAGWYQVQDNDYSGSGYDRGHMCPSADRTNSVANNSATFLMTNFVPQLAANNQGPWNEFENYCRTIANAGNEVYIIDGPAGNLGTIANGHVTIPKYTWKVVLVLPNGSDDLSRVSRATRAFGIIVPNFAPLSQSAPWRSFRVTVNQVELLTGYDFFSAIPKNTQELIERKRDLQ